jgi:hypothetical protein
MKHALVATLALCLQLPLQARALDEKTPSTAVNTMCLAPPGSFDNALCDGFLTGFLEGFRRAPMLTETFNVCLPETIDAPTVAAALNSLLRREPKSNSDATGLIVTMALLKRFPCKL